MWKQLEWTLAGSLGLALLAGTAPARGGDFKHGDGKDPDQYCRSLKLQAVSVYYGCLVRAADDHGKQSRCDDRFTAAFERADALSPGCEPLGNLRRTQLGVQNQAREALIGDISQPPCQGIISGTTLVTCQLHAPGDNITNTVAVLSDILTQIQTYPDCPACAEVTDQTPMWLQAWGGTGGDPDDQSEGLPGFAQMVTSLSGLEGNGILQLYFYLGASGSNNGKITGGSGGAATLVTSQDLTQSPSQEPDQSAIILVAGGGGGGGGRDTGCLAGSKTPGAGGAGGVAISVTGQDGQRFGQGGQGGDSGGGGGGYSGGGSGGGSDGIGGMGGGGGEGAGGGPPGRTGWYNTGATKLTFTSGEGGGGGGDKNSCVSGGGGGGGGYGGGGGGGDGDANRAASGGGGGGSAAQASTCTDAKAPTTFQTAPSWDGTVYLVFDTAATACP
jgi:hypothetical protein